MATNEQRRELAEDVVVPLSKYAANVTYDGLPPEVVTTLKLSLLDTLGATLAANTLATGLRALVDVARGSGGPPESTIIGFGDRVPALMAAFANGAMAHALNYDARGEGGGHLGATTIPAALAVAERASGVSGKQFLAGLAAGTEILARLGLAITRSAVGNSQTQAPKPLRIQLWGYFSAAAAAGRVLKLSRQEMHSRQHCWPDVSRVPSARQAE